MYQTYCVIFFTLFLSLVSTLVYKQKLTLPLKYTLFIGLLIRLCVLFVFLDVIHYDILSYQIVGQTTLKGLSIYPEIAYYHHPYLPFMLYIEAIDTLFVKWGFHSMFFLKLFFVLFDLLIIKAIDLLSSNRTNALLHAVFPAGILLTAGHGQIDNVAIPFILFSIFYFQKSKLTISHILMSFAILVKTWPLMLVPFFLKLPWKRNFSEISRIVWRRGMLFVVFPLLSIVFYVLIFKTNFIDVIYPSLSYRGTYGNRGISILLSFLLPIESLSNKAIKIATNILTILSIILTLQYKTKDVAKHILIFLLIFSTIVISGTNPIWLVPFIILVKPKYSYMWLMLTGIYMAFNMFNYTVPPSFQSFTNNTTIFIAFLLWIVQIGMLTSLTSRLQISNPIRSKVS